jgi:thioredoxin 1
MGDEQFVDNPDYPIELSDDTIAAAVKKYPFLIVDCWAEWCGPCRMLGPVVESLARKYKGEMVFAKLDVEKNGRTASFYGIRSIPNLLVFKDGEKVGDIIGAMPEEKLLEHIRRFK